MMADAELRETISALFRAQPKAADLCLRVLTSWPKDQPIPLQAYEVDGYRFTIFRDKDDGLEIGRQL